jgi:hypothetical protein
MYFLQFATYAGIPAFFFLFPKSPELFPVRITSGGLHYFAALLFWWFFRILFLCFFATPSQMNKLGALNHIPCSAARKDSKQ